MRGTRRSGWFAAPTRQFAAGLGEGALEAGPNVIIGGSVLCEQSSMASWQGSAIRDSNESEMEYIYHGAHIDAAIRIIRDEALRSTIVTDCKPLEQNRVAVVWLTPKWVPNNLYGNIQFQTSFKKIIEGRHLRWIERDTKFANHRYRFAVCKRDSPLYALSESYDATDKRGPIQFKSEKWIINNRIFIELLFDGDLDKDMFTQIRFTDHDERCRFGNDCPDADIKNYHRSCHFISYILSSRNDSWNGVMTHYDAASSTKTIKPDIDFTLKRLYSLFAIHDSGWCGHARPNDAEDIVRGACALLSYNRFYDAISLIHQIASLQDLKNALEDIISRHFEIAYSLDP